MVMFTDKAVALPLKKRKLRGRRLVVVDIENMVGGADMTQSDVANARHQICKLTELHGQEQVVVGACHHAMLSAGNGWERSRLVVRSGPDGADLALLRVLTEENIAERFDELVLASGDGIFSDVVAELGALGVRVTIVAPRNGCSKRLRMAAKKVIYIDVANANEGDAA